MDCEKFMSMLDRYADLTDVESTQLNEHAQNCDSCKAEVEFLQSIIETTHSLPPIEPPTDFLDTVNARLDETLAAEPRITVFVRNAKPYINRYGTIAACLALGIAIGANGNMLVSRMNGATDGVISSTSTVSNSGTTPETNDTSDVQVSETALPQENINETLLTAPAAVSSTQAPTQKSAQKNTVVTSSTVVSSEQSSVTQEATVKPAKPVVTTAPVTEVPETEAIVTAQPLETNVPMQQAENVAVYTAAETASVPTEETLNPNVRMINEPEDTPQVYAEVDVAAEYSIATATPEFDSTYAATPLSSTILINEADAERVKQIIPEYIESVYGSYYMTTGDKLYKFAQRLESEGIWYYANLTDRGSKISFKLLVK